jgi:hypothetical protein
MIRGMDLAAASPTIGIVATLAAAGVIAALMAVGIRTKLPPPDPNWREHVPTQPPRPSRFWLMVSLGRWLFWVAGIVAALFHLNTLAVAMAVAFVIVTLAATAERFVAMARHRRRPRSEA